jgi:hypothetical protein
VAAGEISHNVGDAASGTKAIGTALGKVLGGIASIRCDVSVIDQRPR